MAESVVKRWRVSITRLIDLNDKDPFAAIERAVNLAQRQKEWPEHLRVEAELLPEVEDDDDDER